VSNLICPLCEGIAAGKRPPYFLIFSDFLKAGKVPAILAEEIRGFRESEEVLALLGKFLWSVVGFSPTKPYRRRWKKLRITGVGLKYVSPAISKHTGVKHMEFKRLLVPVDGSEYSMNAAQCALELAKGMGAEIILLHCHRPFPVMLGEPFLQKAIDHRLDKSQKLLVPYKELFNKHGIQFTDRILDGPPRDIISEVAGIEKCDMIVMGSRGRTDLEGLFLGSATHKVLHTAPCPVLVVR